MKLYTYTNNALQILHHVAGSSQDWTLDSEHTQKLLFQYWLIYLFFCQFLGPKISWAIFHPFSILLFKTTCSQNSHRYHESSKYGIHAILAFKQYSNISCPFDIDEPPPSSPKYQIARFATKHFAHSEVPDL